MPANVTPQYEKAEQRYRQAADDEEKLAALQEMLSTIPKHKGTEKMQADIKRRISQLRKSAGEKPVAKGPDPFHVPRGGAGQVVLFGPPNCGKSALVAATTNAPVKVADYPYATAVPTPGMWAYEDVQIQLVDTPPVTAEHVPTGLFGTVRAADVICLVVDAAAAPLEQAEMLLGLFAEREVALRSVPRSEMAPADRSVYSALLAATKIDAAEPGAAETLRELYAGRIEVLGVSAVTGEGLKALRNRLWELLALIRVYTKEPGQPADMAKPFTLPVGSTVEELARQIHRDLPERMKYARLWGRGHFEGQHVHKTAPLQDKDIVEIHQ